MIDTPVGGLAAAVASEAKKWTKLAKEIEGCFVTTTPSVKPQLDPFRATLLLEQIEPAFSSMSNPRGTEIADLKTWAHQERRRAVAEFEPAIRTLCASEKLHLEGHLPHFIVAGFLEVIIQDKQPVCKVAGHTFDTINLSLIGPVILEKVKTDAARRFDPVQFLEELHKAYQRTVRNDGTREGEPVLAKAILPELALVKQSPAFHKSPSKALFNEYTLEHFARDLARLLKDGQLSTVGGKRLYPTPVSDSSNGIPVMIDGAYRFIGRLAFDQDKAQ